MAFLFGSVGSSRPPSTVRSEEHHEEVSRQRSDLLQTEQKESAAHGALSGANRGGRGKKTALIGTVPQRRPGCLAGRCFEATVRPAQLAASSAVTSVWLSLRLKLTFLPRRSSHDLMSFLPEALKLGIIELRSSLVFLSVFAFEDSFEYYHSVSKA